MMVMTRAATPAMPVAAYAAVPITVHLMKLVCLRSQFCILVSALFRNRSHHDRRRSFHRSSSQSVFLARPTASITHPNGTVKKTISDENSIGKYIVRATAIISPEGSPVVSHSVAISLPNPLMGIRGSAESIPSPSSVVSPVYGSSMVLKFSVTIP